jgi:hypothetical protein
MKITQKQNRGVLGEGRNYGMGYAILTTKDGLNFNTVNAFTACKDYLNDLIYVEKTGNLIGAIYGYRHPKVLNIFKDTDYFYLGLKALDYNASSESWSKFNNFSKKLMSNENNLIIGINKVEEFVNLSNKRTILYGKTDEELILKVPIDWVQQTYLISFYTLIIRWLFDKTIEELQVNTFDFISNTWKCFLSADTYLSNHIVEFFKKKYTLKDVEKMYVLPDYRNSSNIHNNAIIHWVRQVVRKKENKLKQKPVTC